MLGYWTTIAEAEVKATYGDTISVEVDAGWNSLLASVI